MSKYIEKIWLGEISPVEYIKQPNREYREKELMLFGKMEEFEEMLNEEQNEVFQIILRRMNEFINVSEKQAFCQGFSLGTCITAESYINADNIGKIK